MKVVVSNRYAGGMGKSLALGPSNQDMSGPDAVLVELADMPDLRASHVQCFVRVFKEVNGQKIVRGSSGDLPGHRVILAIAQIG